MSLSTFFSSISSQGIGIAIGALLGQAPKGYRAIKGNLSKEEGLPNLRTTILRATLTSQERDRGELVVYVEFLNLSRRKVTIEQIVIDWWQFRSTQMNAPISKASELQFDLPSRKSHLMNVTLRLEATDMRTVLEVGAVAHNPQTTPRNQLLLGMKFVAKRTFAVRAQVGPRHLELPNIETFVPS